MTPTRSHEEKAPKKLKALVSIERHYRQKKSTGMDDSNNKILPRKSTQKNNQVTNKKLKKKRTYTSLKYNTIGEKKVPKWTTPMTGPHEEKAFKKLKSLISKKPKLDDTIGEEKVSEWTTPTRWDPTKKST
ncbi:2156_t:CDS:2 [Racocetra fulgida]|uniref:2156_t:CDS:1 n=1 Tax=Racocetra fulgida TaxID=60492 RepID=A0A9N9GEP7_9GLOM|nr:2156_t:CDS:2 [Racocetra fulgida]